MSFSFSFHHVTEATALPHTGHIVLTLTDPAGDAVVFLSPAIAYQLAAQLHAAIAEAEAA